MRDTTATGPYATEPKRYGQAGAAVLSPVTRRVFPHRQQIIDYGQAARPSSADRAGHSSGAVVSKSTSTSRSRLVS